MMIQSNLILSIIFFQFCPIVFLIQAKDVQVTKVELTQCPPEKGKPVNITIHGTTDETLSKGYLYTTLQLGYIKAEDKMVNFCEITSCPLSPGPFVVSFTALDANISQIPCTKFNRFLHWCADEDDGLLFATARISSNCLLRPGVCSINYYIDESIMSL